MPSKERLREAVPYGLLAGVCSCLIVLVTFQLTYGVFSPFPQRWPFLPDGYVVLRALRDGAVVFIGVSGILTLVPRRGFSVMWALSLVAWGYVLLRYSPQYQFGTLHDISIYLQPPFLEWTIYAAPLIAVMLRWYGRLGRPRRLLSVLAVTWVLAFVLILLSEVRYTYRGGHFIGPDPLENDLILTHSILRSGVSFLTKAVLLAWPVAVPLAGLRLAVQGGNRSLLGGAA